MTPILDDRGRLFGKVNVIDLVVVLIVLALVAFAYVRIARPEGGREAGVRSTFVIEKVRQATVDQLIEGKQVRDEGGTLLGVVEAVTVEPTPLEIEVPDEEKTILTDSKLFKDVTIEVKGQGRVSSSNVRIGAVSLRVGKNLTLIGAGFEVKALVIGVKASR